MINLAIDFVNFFDPNVMDAFVSFFAVAGKYGFVFGIFGMLTGMLVKSATGKERFW